MVPKDYVSRKHKKTEPPAPVKASLPWARIVITLSLLAAFAYGLWVLKSQPEVATPEAPVATAPGKQEDPLPDMPEEDYQFIKELEDYEVEVDVTEAPDSDKQYLMQCGSFRDKEQAQSMKAKIAFQGLESMVRSSEGKKGVWYRVILGPYDSKRDAERDRHRIRKANIMTCQIWNWNL